MKKIALASAVAIASISAAQAAPTVYGKVFLTADYFDTSYDKKYTVNTGTATAPNYVRPADDSAVKLNSHASRIGVKGTEALTTNTDLVYQLEYGVDVDTNSNGRADNQQFYSRNTYLGLANKQYGTVLAGRMDTPFRNAKGDVEVFNPHVLTFGIDNTAPLNPATGKPIYNLGETRANNVIAYKSPKMASLPVTFTIATSLSEVDKDTDNKATEKDEGANGYSASVTYDQNGVYLGAGYDNNVTNADNAWRLAGQVDLGKMNMVSGLKLGAMYQQTNLYETKDDMKTWLVSGRYKIANTPWSAKAQYINNKFGKLETDEVAVGGEYAFNATTTGHIYGGQISHKNYKDVTIVGAGIDYKF